MKKLQQAKNEYKAKNELFKKTEQELDVRLAGIGRELRQLYERRPLICAKAMLGEIKEKERDALLNEIISLEKERDIIRYAQKGLQTWKDQKLSRMEREVMELEGSEKRYLELKEKIKKGLNIKPKYDQWAVRHGKQSAKNYFGLETALVVGLNGLITQLQNVGKALDIEDETNKFLDEVKNEK